MPGRSWVALLVSSVLLGQAPGARADAIVVSRAMAAGTIAEFFVEEGRVRVELEIGLDALPAFRNLLPDPVFERLGHGPEPFETRLERFFRENLVLRTDASEALPARALRIEPRARVPRDEITGEPLGPPDAEPEVVVFAELAYDLRVPARSLTIEFSSAPGPLADVGFVLYDRGIAVNDFRYLSPTQTVDLAVNDPWYSRFRTRSLRRRYEAPMSAFLYAEPTEVRAEIVARPHDLQQWIDLDLDGRTTIPVELQAELKQRVGDFFERRLAVTVDGERVRAPVERVHFLRRTLRSSRVIDPPEELDVFSAMLGVIFVYPQVGLPEEATLEWDLWSDRIQRVPAAATDAAGPLPTFLEPDSPVLHWQNFLRDPPTSDRVPVAAPPIVPRLWLRSAAVLFGIAALVLVALQALAALRGRSRSRPVLATGLALAVAAGLALVGARAVAIDDARASDVLSALLLNVYRSFDFHAESDVYDVLSESVDGDLLADIYLETRRGLVLASQGGAQAKVAEIEVLEVSAEPLESSEGFRASAVWTVTGSIGHWGHVHQRTNRYRARLKVEPRDARWKLTAIDIVEEERL